MTTPTSQILNELADREAIKECLYRYSRGVDRLDADKKVLVSRFCDEGEEARVPVGESVPPDGMALFENGAVQISVGHDAAIAGSPASRVELGNGVRIALACRTQDRFQVAH